MLTQLPEAWEKLSLRQREWVLDSQWDGKTCLLPEGVDLDLRVASGVSVQFFELYEQPGQRTVRLQMEPESHVRHVRLQLGPAQMHYQSRLVVEQQKESQLQVTVVSAGGGSVGLSTEVKQVGERAETSIEGLYLVQAGQTVAMTALVHHAVPFGQSRQLFKGILAEGAKAQFCGRIYIAPDAQQVDSKQLSSALILGKQATIETKPELEIYADDVKAAHGATVGQLDPEEIFYLQSRGLSEAQAIQLLAHGFMAEIILHITDPVAQKFVLENTATSLAQLEQQFVVRGR